MNHTSNGRVLALFSIFLLLVSMALPAFNLQSEEGPDEVHGIVAAILGIFMLLMTSEFPLTGFLLFICWAANPIFLLLVILKFTRKEIAPQLIWILRILPFLFIFLSLTEDMKLRIGYVVWLSSMMLMSYACQMPDPVEEKKDEPVIKDVKKRQKVKALPSADIRGMKRVRMQGRAHS